jgi:predicted transcriptional regulator of viral defense system
MSAVAMYSALRRLSVPVLTTAEAAAALRTTGSAASRGLRTLERQGLVRRLRHGLWTLEDRPLDPRAIVTELTRPFPAYISFQSALAARGAIDQIPREISVASMAKPRRIETRLATYVIHRLPPALFGGFEESDGVALATVEKALFDYFYVASASGRTRARLPELDLPANFSRERLDTWLARIRSERLRTRVRAAIERALEHAEYEDARGARRRRAIATQLTRRR